MPRELLDVLKACPATTTWRTPGRAAEPDLAGARDKALCSWASTPPSAIRSWWRSTSSTSTSTPQEVPVPLVGRAVAPSPTGESFGF